MAWAAARAMGGACGGRLASVCVWFAVALTGCRAEPETQLVTRSEALLPAADPNIPTQHDDAACAFVEREARKLNAAMPRQLDDDTTATRVSARGCELTLEYQMLNLAASEVAPSGMYAMRTQVVEQLCADTAARATLERGGAFTNLYRDQSGATIGHFTVRKRDCKSARHTALEESRL